MFWPVFYILAWCEGLSGGGGCLVVVANFRGVFGVSPAQIGKYDDPTNRNINQAPDKVSIKRADQYPEDRTNDPEDYKYSAKSGISFHAILLDATRIGFYLPSFTHKDGQSQT